MIWQPDTKLWVPGDLSRTRPRERGSVGVMAQRMPLKPMAHVPVYNARTSAGTSGAYLNSASGNFLTNWVASAFTIPFWAKFVTTTPSNVYICESDGGIYGQWAIIAGFVAGKIEFFGNGAGNTGVNDPRTGTQITIADTAWHHYAYRYAGSAAEYCYFVDGVKTVITSGATFTLISGASSSTFKVFSSGGGNELAGSLFDIAIFETALSDANIASLHAGTLTKDLGVTVKDSWELDGSSPETDNGTQAKNLTVNGTGWSTVTGPF